MAISSAARRWARASIAAARFVEKPDAATAAAYVAGGRHDWNGGIFLMRAGTYLDALAAHAPDMAGAAAGGDGGRARATGGRLHPDAGRLRRVAGPVDRLCGDGESGQGGGRAGRGRLVGHRQLRGAALASRTRDGDGNVVAGPGLALDAKGCLIRSEGPLVAAIGVEDLVDRRHRAMRCWSCRGRRASGSRTLVEALKAEGRGEWT